MSQSEYMESSLPDDIALKLVSSLQAFAKTLQRNFIGVQLDGSQHVEPLHNCIPETTAKESAKLVKETAENVDKAVRELPDANSMTQLK